MPVSIHDMLDLLKSEVGNLQQQSDQDSDVAPMSALVDTPSKEELKQLEMKRAEKSLKMASASSASEDEQSANEKRKKLQGLQ